MARSLLLPRADFQPSSPFSKKGALTLFWLLGRGQSNQEFSINEAAREVGVRPFTVQRAVHSLHHEGVIRSRGVSTKKRFYLDDPKQLLIQWLRYYQIQRRSTLHRYQIGDPRTLEKRGPELLHRHSVPALHSAARSIFRTSVTNLETTEAHVLTPNHVAALAKDLALAPADRGYEVLLVEPYYSGVVTWFHASPKDPVRKGALALLTFLDLYHFPLRGREQAEALFRNVHLFKTFGSWRDIEAAGP